MLVIEPEEWKPRSRVDRESSMTLPQTGFDIVGPDCQWKVQQGFPEVPRTVTDFKEWQVEGYGPFRHRESITALEGRAFVKAFQIAALDPSLHDSRVLFLLDNFGTTCAVEKGRATCHALLQCC
eukprot:2768498-Amphidinium_carterae.1